VPPPIAPPLETELIVVPSDGNIITSPIVDGMDFGRREDATIRLHEPWIGRRHLQFRWTERGLTVRGFGPGSGTWLREARIDGEDRLLHVGDIVLAGQTPLLFHHRLAPPWWWDDARDFLDQIRASPADDGPRLVFADWLASRDPARAEFIVCQITNTPEAVVRAAELERVEFAAPLAIPVESWTFERGFLGTARILYYHSGDRLREDHPLRDVLALHYPPPPFRRDQ
jgi:uncharacterized protein (TIGR02996 family)